MNGNDAQAKAAKFGGKMFLNLPSENVWLIYLFICAGNLTQANVHCFLC